MTPVTVPPSNDHTKAGNISQSQGIAIGTMATAVHVNALGDVGDVITGTKISLVNRANAPRVASKRQVAPPPGDYIARPAAEDALRALLTVANQGSLQTVYLTGLPGVGKSWLSRRVVSVLEDDFPDGILGADLQTTNLRTAVWNFIEPYDETISRTSLTNAGEFTGAMQAAFGDRRILIVLDHMEAWRDNWQEVRDWLPYECHNVVVLLIAHQLPPVAHTTDRSFRLSGMTVDEAVQMFIQRLSSGDGTLECDEATMQALSAQLGYMPEAIDAVARDINVKLIAPEVYLSSLANRNHGEPGATEHWSDLDALVARLPAEAGRLVPFLGLLSPHPWTASDLLGISLHKASDIDIGLAQLLRAGVIDSAEKGRYHTPLTIRDYAMHKLDELGGRQLLEATMALRGADLMRKAEHVLRYARQSILGEVWQHEENRAQLVASVARQFNGRVTTAIRESPDTNLLAMPLDPLRDFFEDVVLTTQPYVHDWLELMQASRFPLLRSQLEVVFDWAVSHESWSYVRRFASRLGANTSWIVNTEQSGESADRNWVSLGFVFALLKNVVVEKIEVSNVVMKGTSVNSTCWRDCRFVASEWPGTHFVSSEFRRNDMVGIVMPGAIVTGCTFSDIDARFGDFRGTIFQQSTFDNVNFRAARFESAKFVDCYFNRVDFRQTILEASVGSTGPGK